MHAEIIEFFIDPRASPYTITKISIYLGLLIASSFLIFKLLKKLKIRLNFKFLTSLIPFALLAGTLRALEDQKIFSSIFLFTPWLYFLIFSITFSSILFSKFFHKKLRIDFNLLNFSIGILLFAFFLSLFQFKNLIHLIKIVQLFSVWPFIFKAMKLSFEKNFLLSIHMLDSSSSFYLSNFLNFEEYYFSALFGFYPSNLIIPIKLLGIFLILKFLEREKDKDLANFLKILIMAFGLGPATRNLINSTFA